VSGRRHSAYSHRGFGRTRIRFEKVKINLIGEEIRRIFEGGARDSENDGWKVFHKKYPTAGGFITLSRVGFNKEKTQSLIYVAHNCGWLCGEGNYILLVKKDNI
jgi:hypothetical protein